MRRRNPQAAAAVLIRLQVQAVAENAIPNESECGRRSDTRCRLIRRNGICHQVKRLAGCHVDTHRLWCTHNRRRTEIAQVGRGNITGIESCTVSGPVDKIRGAPASCVGHCNTRAAAALRANSQEASIDHRRSRGSSWEGLYSATG